jgi:tetratricopeptide (TPR) repeat protein
LERGMLFELPVPLVVLQSICADLVGFEGFVERARALGLVEAGLMDKLVRVPRVLGLVVPRNQQELAAIGVPALYQAWITEAEFSTEDQRLEIHRLALLAGNAEIAVEMAKRLSDSWISRSLYRAARDICEETLPLQKDSKIIYNLSKIYETLGDLSKSLDYCQQSIKIQREIGDRQGEAGSLAQMAAIAYQQGNINQVQKLYLEAAVLLGSISNYGDLITVLSNLGTNDEPESIGYLAQSLWLMIKLLPNLKDVITLITYIYSKISKGDRIELLLGATAIYLCHSYQHPELEKLTEVSSNIIGHAAQQQGIETQADYYNWITQNRLNDPDYFLPELLKELAVIVGDNWLFDRDAFLARNRSAE